jgi:trans-2-enoyl-CoA reductase
MPENLRKSKLFEKTFCGDIELLAEKNMLPIGETANNHLRQRVIKNIACLFKNIQLIIHSLAGAVLTMIT